MKKLKDVFMFFNCDENKSPESMNPLYNTEVFKDNRDGRRALLKIIKENIIDNKIEVINEYNKVREDILDGEPTNINSYTKYGIIIKLKCN